MVIKRGAGCLSYRRRYGVQRGNLDRKLAVNERTVPGGVETKQC